MNQIIFGLQNTLKPIIDKINAQKDVTSDWKASTSNINFYVKILGDNSTKLAGLLAKETDATNKTIITRQQVAIQTVIDSKKVVEQRVGLSAISQDVYDAQTIIKQLTPVAVSAMDPKSIQAAIVQYDKDKIPTPLIAKYTELFNAITKLRNTLILDLTTLNGMDQKDPNVLALKASATKFSSSKAVAGSMCALLQSYGFSPLLSRGIAAQVQPVP